MEELEEEHNKDDREDDENVINSTIHCIIILFVSAHTQCLHGFGSTSVARGESHTAENSLRFRTCPAR
jgi:hypothetical protein